MFLADNCKSLLQCAKTNIQAFVEALTHLQIFKWIERNNIPKEDEILEVGCGEGRDALYLAEQGYNITALDASNSAIEKCRELAGHKGIFVQWIVNDALYADKLFNRRFKCIYSIATLHMLVDDNDRSGFLYSLYNLLKPNGKLLLVIMGDGKTERKSDISTTFELQERSHMATGKKIMVAGTSCRVVNWETHQKELLDAGFTIDKKMITENKKYGNCMTIYLTRK